MASEPDGCKRQLRRCNSLPASVLKPIVPDVRETTVPLQNVIDHGDQCVEDLVHRCLQSMPPKYVAAFATSIAKEEVYVSLCAGTESPLMSKTAVRNGARSFLGLENVGPLVHGLSAEIDGKKQRFLKMMVGEHLEILTPDATNLLGESCPCVINNREMKIPNSRMLSPAFHAKI